MGTAIFLAKPHCMYMSFKSCSVGVLCQSICRVVFAGNFDELKFFATELVLDPEIRS